MKKLKFDHTAEDTVYDVLGYSHMVISEMEEAFIKRMIALYKENNDMSKTEAFEKIVRETDFEKTYQIIPDGANFYFLLGYVFNNVNQEVVSRLIREQAADVIKEAFVDALIGGHHEHHHGEEEKPKKKKSILDPVD